MSANPATLWTPEEDARLRELHAQRNPTLSYTEIAAVIGRKRNSCIGRAHRLDLPDRSEMRNHGRRSAPIHRHGPVSTTRLFNAQHRQVAAVRTVLADGSAGCLWPSGDRPFTFCGCPVEKGLPYCAEHARLAYRPRRAA